jgi:hypothetical protein
MVHNRKNLQPKRQIYLTLPLILYMVGWNYNSAAAAGITYHVDNTNISCSDLGTGLTPALPFCTIGKGASIAIAGSTVQVLAGSYTETVNSANSGSAGLPITNSAAPGVTVTGATPNNNGFRMSGRSYIIVDGFAITGNVAVTGLNSNGIVALIIPAGVAMGSVTTNAASTSTDNKVTYDSVKPAVASTDLTTSYTGTGPGSIIATFSKAVKDPTGNSGTDDVTNPANYLVVNIHSPQPIAFNCKSMEIRCAQ